MRCTLGTTVDCSTCSCSSSRTEIEPSCFVPQCVRKGRRDERRRFRFTKRAGALRPEHRWPPIAPSESWTVPTMSAVVRHIYKEKPGPPDTAARTSWGGRTYRPRWDFRSPGTSCNEWQAAAIGSDERKQSVRIWYAQKRVCGLAARVFPANPMGRAGIEPATLGLKVPCSTN
jgi:hypothetical protein